LATHNKVADFWPILKESIIKWLSSQCEAIYRAIMNFLVFRPFAFIISKKNRLHLFELIKDKATLKVRYRGSHLNKSSFLWQTYPCKPFVQTGPLWESLCMDGVMNQWLTGRSVSAKWMAIGQFMFSESEYRHENCILPTFQP
jgi:hypothetical protein